jgi:hypothetical protein
VELFMAKTDCIVFYSWQSDLSPKTNRYFILDALKNVAKSLRKDESSQVNLIIDRDTQDVPGSPEIANTILGKIDRAQIFVCDLSIINQGATRTTPNPNVLIELGWALKALGKDRIIMLLNEAYGDMKLLPFDLFTYRITPYYLAEHEDRASARKDLESILKAALFSILHAIDISQPEEEVVSLAEQARHSIESNRQDQKARVRDYMNEVANQISLVTPKDSSGELDEQLIQALEESTGLVIEFSQLAKTIAEMNVDDAAMAMYKGFAKVLDLYTLPAGASYANHTIAQDLAKFLGHELFVSFLSFFMQMDHWEIIANLLDQELYARIANFEYHHLAPYIGLSTPVPLLYKRGDRLRELNKQVEKSIQALLLYERHSKGELASIVQIEHFVEADLFLFLRAQFQLTEKQPLPAWMPWSTVYMPDRQIPRFLLEATRFSYANQLLRPLGVEDIATLRTRLQESSLVLNDFWSRGFYMPWSSPLDGFDFDSIGSKAAPPLFG